MNRAIAHWLPRKIATSGGGGFAMTGREECQLDSIHRAARDDLAGQEWLVS